MSVIKEVAPTKDAKTDDELGVAEFQNRYFKGFPTYMDSEKKVFRLVSGGKLKSFSLWQVLGQLSFFGIGDMLGFSAIGKRWKKAGIDTWNLKGEGLIKGGLMIFDKDGKLAYRKEEEEGVDLPYEEIIAAAKKLTGK